MGRARVDTTNENNFTALRLLLASLVVVAHFRVLAGGEVGDFPLMFRYGNFAVDGFFVVSGFLISGSFDRDRDLVRFYVRRLFRIYPLYLAVVVAQTAIIAVLAARSGGLGLLPLARYLAANALFVNFLQPDVGQALDGLAVATLNPSLWTLKIEVAFYLVLPALWLMAERFGMVVLAVLFAGSVAYASLLAPAHVELARQLPGQLQYFTVGMAAYVLRDRVRLGPAAACILLAALMVAYTWQSALLLRVPVLDPLLVGGIVILAALHAPILRLSNDVSFGVYLLHGPLIQVSLLLGFYQPGLGGLAAVFVAVLLLSALAERAIELPGIALGRRLTQRLRAAGRRQAVTIGARPL